MVLGGAVEVQAVWVSEPSTQCGFSYRQSGMLLDIHAEEMIIEEIRFLPEGLRSNLGSRLAT